MRRVAGSWKACRALGRRWRQGQREVTGLAWLSRFLPTPSTPDGKPSQCVVREVQNRLKPQGLSANHVDDVTSSDEIGLGYVLEFFDFDT